MGAHSPAALIAIEVGGMIESGEILTYRGDPATQATPKFDPLFQQAGGHVTIGIGDGGNEPGFGATPQAAGEALAGGGARKPAPATEVDHVLPASGSSIRRSANRSCSRGRAT